MMALNFLPCHVGLKSKEMDINHTSCFCGLAFIPARSSYCYVWFSFPWSSCPRSTQGPWSNSPSSFVGEAGGNFTKCYPAHHCSLRKSYLGYWTVCILIARIKGQLQKVKVWKGLAKARDSPARQWTWLELMLCCRSWRRQVSFQRLSRWRSFWAEELAFGWFCLQWIISQRMALCHHLLLFWWTKAWADEGQCVWPGACTCARIPARHKQKPVISQGT